METKNGNQVNSYPPYLYKYYKCNENNLKVLEKGKIWASDPLKFNDPFDCSVQFWKLDNFPRNFAIDLLQEDDPQTDHKNLSTPTLRDKYFKNLLQIFGVYCLNEGQNEDLFWGYYNDHEGFAIIFDTNKLVEYWELQPHKINYITANELASMKVSLSSNRKDNAKNLFSWLTVKKGDWIHENEWRFIFLLNPSKKDPRKIKFSLGAIKEVVFGFKFFEGTAIEYRKGGIFKHTFNSKNENDNKQVNYNLEILKFFNIHKDYPLFQVALDENFTLYHLPIFIQEINGNEVIIFRKFPKEQLKIMDSENNLYKHH